MLAKLAKDSTITLASNSSLAVEHSSYSKMKPTFRQEHKCLFDF